MNVISIMFENPRFFKLSYMTFCDLLHSQYKSLNYIILHSINNSKMTKNWVSLDQVKERFDDFEETKVEGKLIQWWQKQKLGDALYGDVIWAISVDDGSIFAIKRLNMFKSEKEYNNDCIEALKTEVEILKNHENSHIISYIGSEIIENKFCIYLEYAPNGSIMSLYKKFGPLREPMIRSYTRQILGGLQYLHMNNIVHHDLKCANVLLDASGKAKLSDFG